MKAILPLRFLVIAAIFFATSNVHAVQVTYTATQTGAASGNFSGSASNSLNAFERTEASQFQFTGNVRPDRTGLIGVSTGFRLGTFGRLGDSFPEGPEDNFENGPQDPDDTPPVTPVPDFGWKSIDIRTRAVGNFATTAAISGLGIANNVGFVQFDWLLTGVSGITIDASENEPGGVQVVEAVSSASLVATADAGLAPTDSFLHRPDRGEDGSVVDVQTPAIQLESFLVPFDVVQLAPGEAPLINIDFQLAVETRATFTSGTGVGFLSAIFDADFGNTATLTNVTVVDELGVPIVGASVADATTGESLVAVAVPEPSAAIVLLLVGCAGAIGRRRAP